MPEKLTLNDGTQLAGYCIENGRDLYVYLYGKTLADAYLQLSSRAKTKKITSEQYEDKKIYTGFTHLRVISEEEGGMVSAVLRKEER